MVLKSRMRPHPHIFRRPVKYRRPPSEIMGDSRESVGGWTLYKLEESIEAVEKAIRLMKEPFIYDRANHDRAIFFTPLNDGEIVVGHLIYKTLSKATGEKAYFHIAQKASNEDEKWGEWRNKGLTGKYYYKFLLKPEYVKILNGALQNRLRDLMRQHFFAQSEIALKKKKEAGLFRLYAMEVITVTEPRGGETGIDGYSESILTNRQGDSVTMVERNVFDFGYYVFPKRLGGTQKIFDRRCWTGEEKRAEKWLFKFGPLKNKGLRM